MTVKIEFTVKAEPDSQVLVRVLTAITRRRMALLSFRSGLVEANSLLLLSFVVKLSREQAEKFSSQLTRQIDIHAATYCELQTQIVCKTEPLKSSMT